MKEILLEEVNYKDLGKCLKITNNIIELYVTLEFGPRIIHYSYLNRENILNDRSPLTMQAGNETWIMIGGHRLWHSPEQNPRTYMPDNDAVNYEIVGNCVKIIQKEEKWSQLQKVIELVLDPFTTEVKLIHKIINKNAWDVEFAAWGITVMRNNGVEIIPLAKNDTGYLPNSSISLWPYTKMNDPRVYWGENFILLKQDKTILQPFKIGITNYNGWVGYHFKDLLFIKKFTVIENGKYPDHGVFFETYTNQDIIELETLSELKRIAPNEVLTHEEQWTLHKDIEFPSYNEDVIAKIINNL